MAVFLKTLTPSNFLREQIECEADVPIEKSEHRIGGERCRPIYRAGLNRVRQCGIRQTQMHRNGVRTYVRTIKTNFRYMDCLVPCTRSVQPCPTTW